MEIGEPQRVIVVEPLEMPAPLRREEPAQPDLAPEPDREPVGVPA